MSLEDTRPIVSTTTINTHPAVIGFDLCYLLGEHPDIELASIRLIREGDGVHIVGRVGKLAAAPEPECPHCHTHGTHDHTDYCCTLWPEYVCPHRLQGEAGPELVDMPAGYGHRLVPSDTLIPGVTVEPEPDNSRASRRPCSCPGLGINPDCRLHNHDPAEDEPEPRTLADQLGHVSEKFPTTMGDRCGTTDPTNEPPWHHWCAVHRCRGQHICGCGHQWTTTMLDALAAAHEPEWVDDGCRCPTRDNHQPGCPAT